MQFNETTTWTSSHIFNLYLSKSNELFRNEVLVREGAWNFVFSHKREFFIEILRNLEPLLCPEEILNEPPGPVIIRNNYLYKCPQNHNYYKAKLNSMDLVVISVRKTLILLITHQES